MFDGAAATLKPGGWFVFSTEAAEGTASPCAATAATPTGAAISPTWRPAGSKSSSASPPCSAARPAWRWRVTTS
uniref:Uncharacterized protein n=1 Tax=Phenylobacterium glaciei TaxID=2803784 RepID=A0A974P1D9_9CAUL|nr:hypothetical protein JKL49_21165 [Phenylobacterium glaciei]